jgi:hypothetical protein
MEQERPSRTLNGLGLARVKIRVDGILQMRQAYNLVARTSYRWIVVITLY